MCVSGEEICVSVVASTEGCQQTGPGLSILFALQTIAELDHNQLDCLADISPLPAVGSLFTIVVTITNIAGLV